MAPQRQNVPLHPHPHLAGEALVPEQEEGEAACNGSGAQTWKFILSLGWCTRTRPPQWPWLWERSHSCRRDWGNGCCWGRRFLCRKGRWSWDDMDMDKGKENGQCWIKKKLNTASTHGVVMLMGVTNTKRWVVLAESRSWLRFLPSNPPPSHFPFVLPPFLWGVYQNSESGQSSQRTSSHRTVHTLPPPTSSSL